MSLLSVNRYCQTAGLPTVVPGPIVSVPATGVDLVASRVVVVLSVAVRPVENVQQSIACVSLSYSWKHYRQLEAIATNSDCWLRQNIQYNTIYNI